MSRFKTIGYKFIAELIFWFHVFVGFVLLFFWEFKPLYPYYLAVLLIAVISNSLSDFFLAKWECYFRKKLDPSLDFETFFTYYFKRFFGLKLNPKKVHKAILIILWSLLSLNIMYWLYIYAR